MSFSHIRMILRSMVQNKRSTLISFIGLIFGLTSFVVVYSWIRTEFSMDRFHTHKNSMYHMVIQFPDGVLDSNTPYALAPEMKDAFPEIINYTRVVRLATNSNSSFNFFQTILILNRFMNQMWSRLIQAFSRCLVIPRYTVTGL